MNGLSASAVIVDELDDGLPTADQAPPRSPIDSILPGMVPPPDFDPLAGGILMLHQREWIDDKSPLKLAEKGRRTGFTFAEALDDTITAASVKSAGGDNIYYIGDTKEKGLEFIATCASFARSVARELLEIDEFVFEDVQEDGSTKGITSYRIRFASGFQIVALSSRPENIRGLQGIVVIDEAAFHKNIAKLLDAVNALLIWGGKIRIISTHNGALNAFNELIKETREGKFSYSLHRATFDDAVANGLYERVCFMRGNEATAEGKAEWYRKIRAAYGTRTEAMREELDAIPREGEGTWLPLAWIEKCSTQEYTVARWEPPPKRAGLPEFVHWPEHLRRAEMLLWLEEHVKPVLARFGNQSLTWFVGGDFAMRQDRSAYPIGFVDQVLNRRVPLIVELKQCPYDQQKQALFYIVDMLAMLGRFGGGILDANGNGMALAQEAAQKYGPERIVELIASDAWRREYGPTFNAAFQDGTIWIPADVDVRNDLRQFQVIGGVAKMPKHVRVEGTDGGKRHGDAGVALWNFYAATMNDTAPDYAYQPVGRSRGSAFDGGKDDERDYWQQPAGMDRFGRGYI